MARSKSSHQWLREHFDDVYVRRAQQEGFRSRAVYKLVEINERDRILRPGRTVVDLGAAPGGWSQLAAAEVGESGRVIATDILPMDALAGVEFIQGDFREHAVLETILGRLGERRVDLVMSDMAPNISGMKAVDQPRGMYLCELALELAGRILAPEGDLLMKMFQGEGSDALIRDLRQRFARVLIRKPRASRARSAEVYVLARNHNVV